MRISQIRGLATTLYLAHHLKKPIFLEGEPGVGKTEVAKVLADSTNAKLIRLQCYEGLDVNSALYEWNYTRQILQLRIDEAQGRDKENIGTDLFSEAFLLKRPLLEAIQSDDEVPPVLLIDEVDRSDSEFEAFLLEVLSDFQITIPEIGTIRAKHIPHVVLTSNRTREVHEALKRRCLYQWIDYPTIEKELAIVQTKLPDIEAHLAEQLCRIMQLWRQGDYYKKPGVAETLDWALALIALGKAQLNAEVVMETLGVSLSIRTTFNAPARWNYLNWDYSMNENNKNRQIATKIFRGIGYLLLVGAAFCTMIPMLWLLTSSFKTANEIFAVPIQWLPSLPQRVAASPYTLENAYREIEKPEAVDETVWKTLAPELTQIVWTQAQAHLAANPQLSNYVPSEELQTETVQGLWQQLIAGLPDEVWRGTTPSIVAAVEAAIIPEAVDTIWSSVYREVAVGTLQIEDLDFNRPPIEAVQWEAETGTRIRTSEDAQTAANISYQFRDDKNYSHDSNPLITDPG